MKIKFSTRKPRVQAMRRSFLAGCLLSTTVSEAAPAKRLPPVLPPRSLAKTAVPRKTAANMAKKAQLSPLPPTGSKLSAKPKPRYPSVVAATGRTNPDTQSVGLADQRILDNATALEFTLEDAIAFSLANNPERREAQAAVNAATANIGSVGAQGKLQVGADGETQYGRNTSTSNSIASTSGGGTAANPSHSFLRFDQLMVNASLPIMDGGKVKASTRQARFQALAQIYQLAQVEQDLILSTTLGYLDVLRNQQLLRVTNSNLSVSQERLRIASLRYGVGASARLDVLQAQTALADARTRRIQAVNAVGTANATLNVVLGRSPEIPIRLAPITRLNLPNIAYGITPSSVLPAGGNNQSQNNGAANNGNTANATGNNGNNPTGNTGNTPNGAPNTNNAPNAAGGNNANDGTNNANRTTNGANNPNGNNNANTPTTNNGANAPLNLPGASTAPGAVLGGPSAPAGNAPAATTGQTNNAAGTTANTATQPATEGAAANTNGAANTTGTATTGGTAPSTTAGSATSSMANLGSGNIPANASTGLQGLAGSTRDSLAVTQAQIGAAQAAVDIAKAGKKPQLGLTLGALLRNPATFLGNFGASIGLGLAQNLFDSGRTRGQVDTAKAALEELQAHLDGQRLQVASAIEVSLLGLDSAQRRQANTAAGVRSAQEALRVAQIGFRSGVRTTLDLADAQAALLSAQTDAVNARFDVADAQATLAAAVGIYTVEAQRARERAIRQQQEAAAQAQKQIEILQPKPKKKPKRVFVTTNPKGPR